MSRVTSFIIGLASGIYLDQTHKMPNIKRWVQYALDTVSEWEKENRK